AEPGPADRRARRHREGHLELRRRLRAEDHDPRLEDPALVGADREAQLVVVLHRGAVGQRLVRRLADDHVDLAGRTGRTGGARGTDVALRALRARGADGADRSLISGRTLHALLPDVALRTLRAGVALRALSAGVALRTLCALRALRPDVAL